MIKLDADQPDVNQIAAELEADGADVTIVHHHATHPRLAAMWAKARPLVKVSLYGAAFVGGGLLLANLLGPRTVRRLGRDGGQAFAEGVAKVQNQISAVTRGARWS